MAEPSPIEVHKALADDTRFRLYRYLRLSGRPVSVRELSIRLGLHVNTLRQRLAKITDLTGRDPRRTNDRVDLVLALEAETLI